MMLLQQKIFFIKFDHLIGTVFIQSELNCSIGVSSRGNLAALSSMNSLHNSCLDISRMVSESEKRAANSNSLISPPVTPVSLETDGFVPLVLPVVTKVGAWRMQMLVKQKGGVVLREALTLQKPHSVLVLATQSFPLWSYEKK